MKRIIPLVLVALSLVACEQKEKHEPAMSVANKTFRHEESKDMRYRFTNDSVYKMHFQSKVGGTYVQEDDVVIMRLDGSYGPQHAFVKKQLLIVSGGDVYMLDE